MSQFFQHLNRSQSSSRSKRWSRNIWAWCRSKRKLAQQKLYQECRAVLKYFTWTTLLNTVTGVIQRRLTGLAAEIAYNAMLSFFPAILAFLAALQFFDIFRPALRRVTGQFAEVAPLDVVNLVRNFVDREGGQGTFTLSFLVMIWVASSAMGTAMTALDQIQQVPRHQRRPFWQSRLIAVCLTLGSISFYILASLLVFVSDFAIRYLAAQAGPMGTRLLALWWVLNWPLALGLIVLAVICLYRFGPSRRQRGTPILPGALFAAITWAGLSSLFRIYILQFGTYSRVYGTLGTAIILMLWLYLTALVVLIGYQLNVTIAQNFQYSEEVFVIRNAADNPVQPDSIDHQCRSIAKQISQHLPKSCNSPKISTPEPSTIKSEHCLPGPDAKKLNYHPSHKDRKSVHHNIEFNPKPKQH